jgi:hypothetical protein
MSFRDKYRYNYAETVKYETKRVQIVFEYYNEQCLDKMLQELREELLSGKQEVDRTAMYGAQSYVIVGRQDFKFKRPVETIEKDGVKYQLVKSRI